MRGFFTQWSIFGTHCSMKRWTQIQSLRWRDGFTATWIVKALKYMDIMKALRTRRDGGRDQHGCDWSKGPFVYCTILWLELYGWSKLHSWKSNTSKHTSARLSPQPLLLIKHLPFLVILTLNMFTDYSSAPCLLYKESAVALSLHSGGKSWQRC